MYSLRKTSEKFLRVAPKISYYIRLKLYICGKYIVISRCESRPLFLNNVCIVIDAK